MAKRNPMNTVDARTDPVARMIRDCTAGEFVAWMVDYHGLSARAAETIESNLREQFKWHRLQGRLDTRPTAAVIAALWGLRGSLAHLQEAPKPALRWRDVGSEPPTERALLVVRDKDHQLAMAMFSPNEGFDYVPDSDCGEAVEWCPLPPL